MTTCTAFSGTKRIASGDLKEVAVRAKEVWDRDRWAQVLIFDDHTSEPIEVDFRGTPEEVGGRIAQDVPEAVPEEAPRWRFGSWWSRPGPPTKVRTGGGARRRRPIGFSR